MAIRPTILLAAGLMLGVSSWAQQTAGGSASAKRPGAAGLGAIKGRILDSKGAAQSGIPVTILGQDGGFIRQIFSGPNGIFDLAHLAPGLYSVEVTLPDFLPFSKAPISIQPGAAVLLNINLRSLAESAEIGVPQNAAQSREDWKWALRAASSARPILRFLDESSSGSAPKPDAGLRHERPMSGTVMVSAGNESRSFGADPGLRTIFGMAYEVSPNSALGIAGSVGWERATPAASLRAAWEQHSDTGSVSTLSGTVRQLFLPSADNGQAFDAGFPFGRRIQSFSGRYENESALTGRLQLRYGALFESVSLGSLHSQMSPYAQLIYGPSAQTQWTFTYTSEAPSALPSSLVGPSLTDQSLTIPQLSSDVARRGTAVLESGRHLEVAWDHKLSRRYRLEAAGFYDTLANVAVAVAPADDSELVAGFLDGLLKDPFSNSEFMDGGNYSSAGARASVEARLDSRSQISVSYIYGGSLRAVAADMSAADASDLRSMVRKQQGSSFVVKVHSVVPKSRTQVVTSYQWLPRNTLVAVDPYPSGLGGAEPYLCVSVVQPLPRAEIFPGHFQAIADFNNLLAQGYVPIQGKDGAMGYFFPSSRSFRGGFSFVF